MEITRVYFFVRKKEKDRKTWAKERDAAKKAKFLWGLNSQNKGSSTERTRSQGCDRDQQKKAQYPPDTQIIAFVLRKIDSPTLRIKIILKSSSSRKPQLYLPISHSSSTKIFENLNNYTRPINLQDHIQKLKILVFTKLLFICHVNFILLFNVPVINTLCSPFLKFILNKVKRKHLF